MKKIIATLAAVALAFGLTSATANADNHDNARKGWDRHRPEARVHAKATAPRTVRVRVKGVAPKTRRGVPYRVAKTNDWTIPTPDRTVARGRIVGKSVAVMRVRFPKARQSRKRHFYVNVYVRGRIVDQQRVFIR